MKKIISLLTLTSLFLAGCTSEEETLIIPKNNDITFSTYINSSTRAESKNTFVKGDVLGLYACQTTGGYANNFISNFMDNVAVTKGATEWTYSPLSSWPADVNEHVSFVAYYPQNTSTSASAQSYPFTVGVDANGHQIDAMWCTVKDANKSDRNGTAINGSETDAAFEPTSGPLNLKFNHMLSRVKVQVKLDATYPGITVVLDSLALNNVYTSGTFVINDDLASGSWTTSGNQSNYTFHSTLDEASAIDATGKVFCDTLMIPQKVSSVSSFFTVVYTHTLAEGGEKTVTKNIPLPGEWTNNFVYNYIINLSLDTDNISVTADVNSMSEGVTYEKPEAVDLGLSVKWASHNLGATKPEEVGAYYSWGELVPKQSSYYGSGSYYTHYSSSSGYINIGDDIAGTSYDAAHMKWGGNWRMPSQAEFAELVGECTWTWTTQNGVDGYLVKATNGNSIFLPVTGYMSGYVEPVNQNYGYYWSSSLKDTSYAYILKFDYYGKYTGTREYMSRCYGLPIRPVYD